MKVRIVIVFVFIVFLTYLSLGPARKIGKEDLVNMATSSEPIIKRPKKGDGPDQPKLANGYPKEWDSMEFFYNQRLDTNVVRVTNVYAINDNLIVTNVQEYRTNKFWNTQAWEDFSRDKVDQQIKHLYPELAQVVEILMEVPAVRRSNRLYSGVYSITFTMDNIRGEIESYLDREETELEVERRYRLQGIEMPSEVAESSRDWLQSQRMDMQRGIHEMMETQRQALIGLYGEMPLPIFQRIMAVESGLTYKL